MQVRFIRSASKELYTLVNDMLDVAKIESGKAALRIEPFLLEDMLAALRGTLRPLLPPDASVELVVEPAPSGLMLETDQGKLAQILRNLVSNALKFTERGEVRLTTTVKEGEPVARAGHPPNPGRTARGGLRQPRTAARRRMMFGAM